MRVKGTNLRVGPSKKGWESLHTLDDIFIALNQDISQRFWIFICNWDLKLRQFSYEEIGLAKKPTTTKKPTSLYLDEKLITRLDKWIKWQQEARGYDIDRSHVVNVLLRRFLERNDSHLNQDNQISLDVE